MGEIYVQYEYWVAAFQLIFAMLGMGATLTASDFYDVIREPRSVTFGILIQILLVPLLAIIFINAFGIAAGIAIGIALIAAIPGGTSSNIFTYMARGNIPLSISITGLTTLACLITTPVILSLLITEHLPNVPNDFSMPTGQIIREIALTLLLPLFFGMGLLKYSPKNAGWISTWSIRLSLFGILMIVVGSASAGRLDLDAFGSENLLLVCGFVAALGTISWLSTKLLSLSRPDSTAIEMEVIVRNVNLGVLIKASMFPAVVGVSDPLGDTVLFTILLYGALQLVIGGLLIAIRRRMTTIAA